MSQVKPSLSMSVKNMIGLSQNFVLRRVDPVDLYDQLTSGAFSTLTLNDIVTEPVKTTVPILELKSATTIHDPVYTYRDTSNYLRTLMTTNQPNYLACLRELPLERQWCDLLQVPFDPSPVGIIGIPLRMDVVDGQTTFWVDGSYVSFRACFYALKRSKESIPRYRNPLYADSEQLLRHWFGLVYPGKVLTECPAPRLLKRENRQGLELSHYLDDSGTEYDPTVNIVTLPVKESYLKIK